MKVLVTGGAGFIGSNLVEALLKDGHEVSILDREYKEFESVKFFRGDIRNYEKVFEALKGVEVVYHLAAQTSVPKSLEDPIEDETTNVLGTLNVLKAGLDRNVKKFIFTSSAAVYGDPEKFPISESAETKPLSPYGLSKLAAEEYCKHFSQVYGMNCAVFRIFNVYGKYSQGVISKFAAAVKKGEPIKIHGSGEQTRDFIHVDDVVRGLILFVNDHRLKPAACLSAYKGRSLTVANSAGTTASKQWNSPDLKKDINNFSVYNIASGKETSINDIAKTFEELGCNLEKENEKQIKGDIFKSIAEISKIREELNFEPEIDLKEGIRKLINEKE